MSLDVHIAQIESKVRKLVEEMHRLKSENEGLRQQIEKISVENLDQKNKLQHSTENNNFANIAKGMLQDGLSKEELIQKIDQYVQQLDKCIDMLND